MALGTKPLPSCRARRLILAGKVSSNLRVSGHLDLSGHDELVQLPDNLTVLSLNLSGCTGLRRLPRGLHVALLRLDHCSSLAALPADFTCHCLEFRHGPLRTLPPGLRVPYRLDLQGCVHLAELPDGLSVQTLSVQDCLSLGSLPPRLDVQDLNLAGCSALEDWPSPTTLRLHRLNLAGCRRLRTLPEGLSIDDLLEVAQSALTELPASLANVRLRWRGVAVDERIAFRPHTLTAEEVLTAPNLETRRIMIERFGYERLFNEAKATILDRDRDAGGERILRLIALERDEDLTCLSVKCPSTGRPYTLRVPPGTRTCRQAAAWLAGFDDPDDYQPVVET